MSWKKYFKVADTSGQFSPIGSGATTPQASNFAFRNYQSKLPEVYTGHPNRVERYNQYEAMDMDSEVNACLDIISEFSTQADDITDSPFDIKYKEKPTDNEVNILTEQLMQWVKLNRFNERLFKMFRNTIKYGDQVFIRDPETFKLMWVESTKVSRVIVNESDGKEPEQYVIQDINPNFQNLTVAAKNTDDFSVNPARGGYTAPNQAPVSGGNLNNNGTRFANSMKESVIDAKHVVHLSLTEGLDVTWPFGTSILENIYKVFKQKEMLEDAILIYRIQRAPERRVFYIDVGNMPSHMAMSFVERVKNEIHQRRIPTQGGGGNTMDATYNPLCIDLNTRIPLLDGRTLSLTNVIDEHNEGKENWVYSTNPVTGKVVPGKVAWAGETRKDAEVLKLHLDNGETLTCTPDHKIPVLGKGFVEAKDLSIDESLISFETNHRTVDDSTKGIKYERVFDHEINEWVFTHRMVKENCELDTFIHEDKYKNYNHVVHHVDFDRFNNSPSNLMHMNKGDHIRYHASKSVWNTHPDTDLIKAKISKTVKEHWKNKSQEEREQFTKDCSQWHKENWTKRKLNVKTYEKYLQAQSVRSKQRFIDNPKSLENFLKSAEGKRVSFNNQEFVWTQPMVSRLITIVKKNDTNKINTIKIVNMDTKFMTLLKDANKPSGKKGQLYKINVDKFTDSQLKRLYRQHSFKGWKDLKKKVHVYNHKIVKIEYLTETMDTGCLNVDNEYHTFAIESGIFIKNSTNEDFFFPQTAEGRGSKVDTLPGGENLGQIDDLRYFNNKLARGLRVPSSYLPSGPDDNSSPLTDGRLGTALIQEFRFNQYCKRMQASLARVLNTEFKLYLAFRGFNIDSSLFDVKFNEPQNFASYRQSELDATRVGTFANLEQYPYLSKRFLLERYLGLSEEEMVKNEEQWEEENAKAKATDAEGSDLRGVGVMPGGFESDIDTMGEIEGMDDMGGEDMDMGGEATGELNPMASEVPPQVSGGDVGGGLT